MKRYAIGIAAALLVGFAGTASAQEKAMETSLGKVLVGDNDMTLYSFDKDTKGAMMSACTGKCIENWPPYLAPADAKADGDWTLVDVTDKDGAMKKMWAYEGWPLYYYVKDTKAGDVTGDMVGGVWHVVKED
jgi:predicted lipoprotein with Yx(FWY)xxD motif